MNEAASPAPAGANRGIKVTLALSMLLASLGTSIANIALPTLADAFSAPFPDVQWVVIAYLAILTISVVFVGRLGDIYGLRRMHIAGAGLFSLASLLCGLAPGLWYLVAARALQGLGAAVLITLTMALARETSGEGRIGRTMGLLGTMSALGTALGPSLGGVLVSATGWQGIFLMQVPVAMLALVLASVWLPRDSGKPGSTPVSLRIVRDARLLPGLFINVLVAAVMMATLVVGPFYLGLGLGLNEVLVGLVMSVGPLISIVSGVPSGRVVDAWGARRVLAVGLTMLAAGAFLLSAIPQIFGVAGYVLAIVVLTPGYQLFQVANNTAVMTGTPKDRRGVVSGLLNLSRNIGLVLGASAMSAVFAFGVGTDDFRQASLVALDTGMRMTFTLAGGLMVAALWVAFGRPTQIGAP